MNSGILLLVRTALVVAADRFTGAAAVAEHWCRALREHGDDARLFFRREGNLQWRLEGCSWAHPLLVKEKTAGRLHENLRVLRSLGDSFDAVVVFLPHDHILALLSGIDRRLPLIRAYRRPRHLRGNPFNSYPARRCAGILTAFRSLEARASLLSGSRHVLSIPAAVEKRFFVHGEQVVRVPSIRGKRSSRPVFGAVGKLAADRGFELLLEAAALSTLDPRILIVGHGEHRKTLEEKARKLGVLEKIHWAGKQETGLPGLLAVMNCLLFSAPGSDWGHRVISEAQAVGIPVISTPVPGVEDLIEDGVSGLILSADARRIACAFDGIVTRPGLAADLRRGARKAASKRAFPAIGTRLHRFLEHLTSISSPG